MLTKIFADHGGAKVRLGILDVAGFEQRLGLPGWTGRIRTPRDLFQLHGLGGLHLILDDLLVVLLGCGNVGVDLGNIWLE